jgi:hypothetical protein
MRRIAGTEADEMAAMLRKFLEGNHCLGEHQWRLEELLCGYGMPPERGSKIGEEEPYVRLLRGLEVLSDAERDKFARQLAALMDRQPDLERDAMAVRWPERLLFNMLSLCTVMPGDHRDTLGPRLDDMRRRAEECIGLKKDEEWEGLSLVARLREAIINNQVDRLRVPEWFAFIEGTGRRGGTATGLDGGRYDGLMGVIKADRPGKVTIEDIGRALTMLVRQFDGPAGMGDDREGREDRLRQIISRIQDYHKDKQGGYWKAQLGAVAEDGGWPQWAKRVLTASCPGREGGGRQR